MDFLTAVNIGLSLFDAVGGGKSGGRRPPGHLRVRSGR